MIIIRFTFVCSKFYVRFPSYIFDKQSIAGIPILLSRIPKDVWDYIGKVCVENWVVIWACWCHLSNPTTVQFECNKFLFLQEIIIIHMGSNWSSKWTAATVFFGHSGQYECKHERRRHSTLFEVIPVLQDTGKLIDFLQENNILPSISKDGYFLVPVQSDSKGDALNDGYKLIKKGFKRGS